MVNLNIIENLDDRIVAEKEEDKIQEDSYKQKVLTAKENIKKMFSIAKEKDISFDEVERDVKKFYKL